MFHGTKPGWIEVISGVMFSGKSEELIRRVRRAVIARNKIQVFKSHLDARYAGIYSVSSHDGTIAEAEPINEAREIMLHLRPDTQVVAVDEAQFLDFGIVELANALADRGVRVILAGIDSDFRAEPFGAMPALMAAAEIVDKLHAICVVCGGPATRNQRLVNGKPAPYDSPQIMVGGHESYEARCRHCHEVPRRDELQRRLFETSAEGLMLTVALTGNVAAGKSMVLGHFQRWGATVVDTDLLARDAVEPGRRTLASIFARFGGDLERADGSLDRALLRRRVMGDDERRAVLNAIVHPEVMRLHAEQIERARLAGAEIVVSDIPLLFEVLDPEAYDVVVLVDAPEETRRRRLMELRGYSEEEARDVIGAQLPSRLKRGKSHIVIDNDGSGEALEANAKAAWETLRAEAARRCAAPR